MDRLFLDANVLFSAAYRSDAGLRRLWGLDGVHLLTSAYAVEEARRNLDGPERLRDLERLLASVEIVRARADAHRSTNITGLRAKDRPILDAAVAVGATHLVTGDVRDFGVYFGKRLAGVLVTTPGDYLRSR